MMKRGLDVVVAGAGLLALSPVLAVIAILIKLDSPGRVLFTQVRVGRRFHPFVIYKFRTMRAGGGLERPITIGNDRRITRVGRVLRHTKLDEIPQLYNVLKGDMSLVGPRPELPQFVERFRSEYAEILEARPGLTDLASIAYRHEAAQLAAAADPEAEYPGAGSPGEDPPRAEVRPALVSRPRSRAHRQDARSPGPIVAAVAHNCALRLLNRIAARADILEIAQ